MDFLSLPRDPIDHGEPSVLPIFSEHGYDDGPFLEYLHRHPNSLFQDTDSGRLIYEAEVQTHYQNWLFFGLLREFLGDLFDENDYITFDSSHDLNRITTLHLRSILQEWSKSRLPRIEDEDPEFSHFRACLEEVWRMLELTERFFTAHGPRMGLQVDVIAALAEMLETTIKEFYRDFCPLNEMKQRYNWLGVSSQARSAVLERCVNTMIDVGGWCPADVQMCLNNFFRLEDWHYLRHLRVRQDCSLHSRCVSLQCKVASTRHSSMLPRHVAPDCRCRSFEAGEAGLARTYERDCLPCLEIAPGEAEVEDVTGLANATNVQVLPVSFKMKNKTRYIAMSHVWSDGTGNGHANSLPLCQLRAFYDRAVRFQQERDSRLHAKTVLLWIDTVCCPYEQGAAKNLALTKMREIYQYATAVHVWDQSLLSWESRNDYQEWLVRILLSMWNRRLWTAQEAIFATRDLEYTVIVHCADAAEPLTSLYRQQHRRDLFGSKFTFDIASQIMRVEKTFWPGVGGRAAQQLLSAAQLLQYRHTSVAADEALVLANILGLDSAEYIGLPQEAAMSKFWSQVFAKLPREERQAGLPFCPTVKLTTPGLRWAPRSLMDANPYGPAAFFASSSDRRNRAEVRPEGFIAHYRGVSVQPHVSPTPECLLGNDVDFCGRNFDQTTFEMADGSWLRIGHDALSGDEFSNATRRMYWLLRTERIAFVFQYPDVKQEPVITHGLAVETKGIKDGVIHAAIDSHVGIVVHRFYPAKLHAAARRVAMKLLSALEDMRSTQVNGVDVQDIFNQYARRALENDADLCDTIRANSRENINAKKDWTFEQVLGDFKDRIHHHAHVGPVDIIEHPEWTKWCLD